MRPIINYINAIDTAFSCNDKRKLKELLSSDTCTNMMRLACKENHEASLQLIFLLELITLYVPYTDGKANWVGVKVTAHPDEKADEEVLSIVFDTEQHGPEVNGFLNNDIFPEQYRKNCCANHAIAQILSDKWALPIMASKRFKLIVRNGDLSRWEIISEIITNRRRLIQVFPADIKKETIAHCVDQQYRTPILIHDLAHADDYIELSLIIDNYFTYLQDFYNEMRHSQPNKAPSIAWFLIDSLGLKLSSELWQLCPQEKIEYIKRIKLLNELVGARTNESELWLGTGEMRRRIDSPSLLSKLIIKTRDGFTLEPEFWAFLVYSYQVNYKNDTEDFRLAMLAYFKDNKELAKQCNNIIATLESNRDAKGMTLVLAVKLNHVFCQHQTASVERKSDEDCTLPMRHLSNHTLFPPTFNAMSSHCRVCPPPPNSSPA